MKKTIIELFDEIRDVLVFIKLAQLSCKLVVFLFEKMRHNLYENI